MMPAAGPVMHFDSEEAVAQLSSHGPDGKCRHEDEGKRQPAPERLLKPVRVVLKSAQLTPSRCREDLLASPDHCSFNAFHAYMHR